MVTLFVASRRARRAAMTLSCAAVLAAFTATADAATVTKNGLPTGIPGFPTVPGGLGVFEAGALPGPADPPDSVREVGTYDVSVAADVPAEAPFAGAWRAYAVTDIRYHTDNGVTYPMVLQLAADAWAGEFTADVPQKLEWLLRNADALIAGEADTAQAAAAIQVVVWQTLRNPPALEPRAHLEIPTTSAAVNALAVKFTALMEAGYTGPSNATVSISAGPVDACASTITVTGTPGAVVTLTIDNNGSLSTKTLVVGADGTATVTASAAPGTTATVSASVASGGVLVRADGLHEADQHTTPTHNTEAPEELIFLAGGALAVATVPVACPGTPPGTPPGVPTGNPTPPSPPLPAARIRLVKTGPATATAGQVVTYRIKLTNSSKTSAAGVVLRDILPAGFSVLKVPKGAVLKKGVLTWKLNTLPAGASKTVAVRVRIDRRASGTRCNRATGSATGVKTVKAAACTSVRAVAGALLVPRVTG